MQLRDYQTDAIRRVRDSYTSGHRRVILQAATGAGKTVMAGKMVELASRKGRPIAFFAHRRRLIDQISNTLKRFGVDHGVMMDGSCHGGHHTVQVVSRDTALSRAVRSRWVAMPAADFVVVDECRHSASDGFQELLAHYPKAHVLGLDATPARNDGRGLGDYFDDLVCAIPTSELVANGFLVPVRCYAPLSRKGRVKSGLAGDPVSHWKKHAEGMPTILFARTVEASVAAASVFSQAGIPAEHLDARSSDEEREAVISRLEASKTQVITNCALFTEGVDIPKLACCILLRKAGTYTLFAQCVGRIMRPSEGKTHAVLIDHAGAIFEHGFPDDDVEWKLEVSETVDERNERDKKAGKRKEPMVCAACSYIYTGGIVCPACGHIAQIVKRGKEDERRGEVLVRIQRKSHEETTPEERNKYWHYCLYVMANKGQKAASAAGMYRAKFGVWPGDDGMLPLPGRHQWRMLVTDLFPWTDRRNRVTPR